MLSFCLVQGISTGHKGLLVKIATYNINNINKRLENLLHWLKTAKPDVVCLQELKCTDAMFPSPQLRSAGYEAVWKGQKSWNGVAILAREMEPVLTRDSLPGDADDSQSRYIEAAVNGVLIASIYLPNGNPQPGPKFDYKLDWFKRLAKHTADLWSMDVPVVLAGDLNVVPTDFDIYNTRSWLDNALLQPESREAFRHVLQQGWTDAVRKLHPDEPMFSFWHYMRNAWERDAGLRLDVLLLSKSVAKRLRAAGVDRDQRARPNASDHAPTWIELK
ncbi:exodeoxyribonuclease III [Phyllobacterium lublinensis]|uniref:exodeoxyribonuclease III n=1 Tax=Phyllobacterium lublinensis TaxID=2875708 RepID=UPI001CCFC3CE|nr:exodeoxyribonuclease III [Phyllobacterium sp. 2063]MBZ9657283.1 exodeoxyribonuclease III [Phyllobacterium sp. 2063]